MSDFGTSPMHFSVLLERFGFETFSVGDSLNILARVEDGEGTQRATVGGAITMDAVVLRETVAIAAAAARAESDEMTTSVSPSLRDA